MACAQEASTMTRAQVLFDTRILLNHGCFWRPDTGTGSDIVGKAFWTTWLIAIVRVTSAVERQDGAESRIPPEEETLLEHKSKLNWDTNLHGISEYSVSIAQTPFPDGG